MNIRSIENVSIRQVQIWDTAGHLWYDKPFSNEPLQLPPASGVYLVAVETSKGRFVEKVIRY